MHRYPQACGRAGNVSALPTICAAQSSNSKIVIMGGGKNGLPIILGNVEAPASPAPQTPTGNADTASKERTTAAAPATPLEKMPAESLTKPAEKTLPAQPPEAQRLSNPFPSLSDVKAAFSRIIGAMAPFGGRPLRQRLSKQACLRSSNINDLNLPTRLSTLTSIVQTEPSQEQGPITGDGLVTNRG
jgi:hypothetical protein